MEKIRIMFDTNAFDKIKSDVPLLKNATEKYEFYITSIQIEELAAIPDDKKNIRISNLKNLCQIRPIVVPTPFTFDHVDFGCFTFHSEPKYSQFLNENKSNMNDALIAAAATYEKCILVTDDKWITHKMELAKENVMSYQNFITNVKRNLSDVG